MSSVIHLGTWSLEIKGQGVVCLQYQPMLILVTVSTLSGSKTTNTNVQHVQQWNITKAKVVTKTLHIPMEYDIVKVLASNS